MGASESIGLFAASIPGGTSNWIGTVIGGLLMRLVPLGPDDLGTSTGIFGFALMMAVVDRPEGLAGLFDRVASKFWASGRR